MVPQDLWIGGELCLKHHHSSGNYILPQHESLQVFKTGHGNGQWEIGNGILVPGDDSIISGAISISM